MRENRVDIMENIGEQMYSLIEKLYPICRSITGKGVRQTLSILKEDIPIQIYEVPSGTKVFDWTVPKEWNINEAWIKDSSGNKIIDFDDFNLHVLNYSIPVDKKISIEELREHIYTIPEHPKWIPYRTSYYTETWGFCMEHDRLESMNAEEYQVYIDSTLEPGSLSYGELFLKGETPNEIIISCHVCHPSLCNDNLSGISVATYLAKYLQSQRHHYSYRFLFIPGTIGSITWLAQNEEKLSNVRHGLVLSCVGDDGDVSWKKTRSEDSELDQAVAKALEDSGDSFNLMDYSPYGYDERQFSSPGINLSVGCFMRTPWGAFPEYHTSADNLDFVHPKYLEDSYKKILNTLYLLENNRTYINLNPKCEPQLGKRGLYSSTGGKVSSPPDQMAVLWVLNQSDGSNSLLEIAKKAEMPFETIKHAADALVEVDLLVEK